MEMSITGKAAWAQIEDQINTIQTESVPSMIMYIFARYIMSMRTFYSSLGEHVLYLALNKRYYDQLMTTMVIGR